MSKDIIEIECRISEYESCNNINRYEYIIYFYGNDAWTFSNAERLCLNYIYPVYVDPIGKINQENVTWKLKKINDNVYSYSVMISHVNEETK